MTICRHLQPWLFGLAVLVLSATSALAQDAAGASDAIFLAEIIGLMVVGRLFGEVMQRLGQPSVMGQLLGGILLGPTVLGWLWPDVQHWIFPDAPEQKAMIDSVAQLGILLLLMLTGMEVDLKLVRQFGRAAIAVSLCGVALPFVCGAALGMVLPAALLPDPASRLFTALFLGTALSISSIKIVAAVVHEMNFTRRNLGMVIVSSAIMEDTIGWIIVSIILGVAGAAEFSVAGTAKSLIGTAAFLFASFTVGRRLVSDLIRRANDYFESEFPVITTILAIMGVFALITQSIGVHTMLGAFISGVLIGESPILTRHIDAQLRGVIVAFFMPVFFGLAGLRTDLAVLAQPQLLAMTIALIAVATIGKFVGAFAGGKIGGLTRRESLALAFAMNARGSTEVIVAAIGLSMGALTQSLFTMIVAMAVATTLAMPPMLRWALARLPMTSEEKKRLEREEFEARGFVTNIERLLLAVDSSPNGRFAARLAALIAAARGLPMTVLPLSATDPPAIDQGAAPDAAEPAADAEAGARQAVAAAAQDSKRTGPAEEAGEVSLTVRKSEAPTEEAVAHEARKGYDMLFAGIKNTRTPAGDFHPDIARIGSVFSGPLAIVEANGDHVDLPERGTLNILVPVNGTEVSRRGAEVAILIARVLDAPVTALYISRSNPRERRERYGGIRARRRERAILRDIVELAEQYGHRIATAVRDDVAPDLAILSQVRRAGNDLIVMGVARRVGETLYFGDTAASVFRNTPVSILLVST
jgi:Kef-type K+ transport system membrane component KefB/nucleotide-binding universal stress UspA family protein